jgi:hypothetical protein
MMSLSSYLTFFTFFLLERSERFNVIDMILSNRSTNVQEFNRLRQFRNADNDFRIKDNDADLMKNKRREQIRFEISEIDD